MQSSTNVMQKANGLSSHHTINKVHAYKSRIRAHAVKTVAARTQIRTIAMYHMDIICNHLAYSCTIIAEEHHSSSVVMLNAQCVYVFGWYSNAVVDRTHCDDDGVALFPANSNANGKMNAHELFRRWTLRPKVLVGWRWKIRSFMCWAKAHGMDIGHERVQQNHEQNETHIRFNGFYALHCDQNDVNRTGSGGPANSSFNHYSKFELLFAITQWRIQYDGTFCIVCYSIFLPHRHMLTSCRYRIIVRKRTEWQEFVNASTHGTLHASCIVVRGHCSMSAICFHTSQRPGQVCPASIRRASILYVFV